MKYGGLERRTQPTLRNHFGIVERCYKFCEGSLEESKSCNHSAYSFKLGLCAYKQAVNNDLDKLEGDTTQPLTFPVVEQIKRKYENE